MNWLFAGLAREGDFSRVSGYLLAVKKEVGAVGFGYDCLARTTL